MVLVKYLLRQKSVVVRPGLVRYSSSKPRLPLEGVKIVDMTRVLAGPYCTQILGDLGAEVIKIEHPVRGDDTRAWGPPFAAPHESAYYLAVNRNKKSIGLNFQSDEGQKILRELVKTADVVVENFVPGNLAKYGLSYNDLAKINDRLIYASITGYGQTGPYRLRPGYDVMVEAEFGLMHITGEANGPPVKVGVAVTDLTTGLYAANSIMASLIHRSVSGKGQHLDVSLSDCQLATLANIASSVLVSGEPDEGRHGTAHPSICPYQAFDTAQGGSVMIGGGNDNLFRLICDAIGKPEWKDDPRFTTNALRVKNRDILIPAMNEVTMQQTTQQWLEHFEGKPFPYAAVNDVRDSLYHPHAQARNMVVTVDHPKIGPLKLVNSPVKYSESQPTVRIPPPTLGQHTSEILHSIGLGREDVVKLRESGVVG
jgi:succinate--hydroxymethylglutarate CoA-transferase